VTADSGEDSMLVVWDSLTATPIRTYLNPHPGGVKAIDISACDNYLVTLGEDNPQTISLWNWTDDKEEGPIVSLKLQYHEDLKELFWAKFNPQDPTEIAVNSVDRVVFLRWEHEHPTFHFYAPTFFKKDFSNPKQAEMNFTKTIFIPEGEQAVTGTTMGDIVVWKMSLIIEGFGE
jgi:WD40 repeat protein